jgi:hypothetical protein
VTRSKKILQKYLTSPNLGAIIKVFRKGSFGGLAAGYEKRAVSNIAMKERNL